MTRPLVGGSISPLPYDVPGLPSATPNPWEVALRELAIESEVFHEVEDPSRIKSAIVLQRCARESKLRQFEQANGILRDRQIPGLEFQLREAREETADATLETQAWVIRARNAERQVVRGLLGVGLSALVAIVSLAVTIHLLIERTTR